MPELAPLPAGCLLRPAKITDKPMIHQMLKNLERELAPVHPSIPWIAWGSLMGFAVFLVALGTIAPETRTLLQFLIGTLLVICLIAIAATLVLLQQEWTRYWVIEYNGYLVACAKLQRHHNYSVLFDLYVAPDWRGRGVGSYFVAYLGQQATKPLYLACLPVRLPFYKRLGFAQVSAKKLPPLLQYDLGLPTRPGIIPLVMS